MALDGIQQARLDNVLSDIRVFFEKRCAITIDHARHDPELPWAEVAIRAVNDARTVDAERCISMAEHEELKLRVATQMNRIVAIDGVQLADHLTDWAKRVYANGIQFRTYAGGTRDTTKIEAVTQASGGEKAVWSCVVTPDAMLIEAMKHLGVKTSQALEAALAYLARPVEIVSSEPTFEHGGW